MEDRFYNEDTGELNDTEIIKALRQAADDYENGEIEEVQPICVISCSSLKKKLYFCSGKKIRNDAD